MSTNLFYAGLLLLVIFGAQLYMSLDGADEVLRTTRKIGAVGVLAGVVLMVSGWVLAVI